MVGSGAQMAGRAEFPSREESQTLTDLSEPGGATRALPSRVPTLTARRRVGVGDESLADRRAVGEVPHAHESVSAACNCHRPFVNVQDRDRGYPLVVPRKRRQYLFRGLRVPHVNCPAPGRENHQLVIYGLTARAVTTSACPE